MILPVLIFVLRPDATAIVHRMEEYFVQHPAFSAKLKLNSFDGGIAQGTLYESRPSKIAYTIAFPDTTYRLANTPEGVIESSSALRVYAEYASDRIIAPPYASFSIADWRMALPTPLFFNHLSEFFPSQLKTTAENSSTINGVPVDVVHFSVRTRHMLYSGHASIDPAGRVLRYVTELKHGPVQVDLSDYVEGPVPATAFTLSALPLGYTLAELPGVPTPLRLDHKLPDAPVTDSTGASQGALSNIVGSPGMLAVVDANWLHSTWGKQAVREIEKMLADKGSGKLVLLNDEKGRTDRASGLLYDPSGAALTDLAIPGSPTFFLINKKGLIERIWCGYHPDDGQFLPELAAAIDKPGESRPDM